MIISALKLVSYLFWSKNWNIKLDTLKNRIRRKRHFIPSGKGSPVSAATFAGMNTWCVKRIQS